MKNNKSVFCIITICTIIITFAGGCISIPGNITFDPDLPKENTAFVIINASIYVKEYNGIDVTKTWYSNNRLRTNKITLPAGETTLLTNLRAEFANGMYSTILIKMDDLVIKYNFEAGKEYSIGVFAKNIDKNIFSKRKLYLAIWNKAYSDANPGIVDDKYILKSWELGEF